MQAVIVFATCSCRRADIGKTLQFYDFNIMCNCCCYDVMAYLVIDIFHDALFFVVDAYHCIHVFGSLQFLTKITIMTTHISVLTAISVELYAAIRDIRYRGALDSKINAHDISVIRISGFRNFINYLGDYLTAFIYDTHGP